MITLGSLFDGIGGWQLAAVRSGVKPLWSSEIDPFPASVTKEHFPDTTKACAGILRRVKAKGKKLPELLEAVLRRQAHDGD